MRVDSGRWNFPGNVVSGRCRGKGDGDEGSVRSIKRTWNIGVCGSQE